MPMHPAAPDDRTGLIDALDQTVQSVIDLGFGCREEDFDRPTHCPGWSVKDQISHVVGVEKSFAGIRAEPVVVPDYPHLRHDAGRDVEREVEARRGRTGRAVVAELADFHPERIASPTWPKPRRLTTAAISSSRVRTFPSSASRMTTRRASNCFGDKPK